MFIIVDKPNFEILEAQ